MAYHSQVLPSIWLSVRSEESPPHQARNDVRQRALALSVANIPVAIACSGDICWQTPDFYYCPTLRHVIVHENACHVGASVASREHTSRLGQWAGGRWTTSEDKICAKLLRRAQNAPRNPFQNRSAERGSSFPRQRKISKQSYRIRGSGRRVACLDGLRLTSAPHPVGPSIAPLRNAGFGFSHNRHFRRSFAKLPHRLLKP
jgi:hypothetical protein